MNPVRANRTAEIFYQLGKKITREPVKQAIEATGTAVIAPLAIIYSPGKKTEKVKNEKKYQALRQIPSVILKFGLAIVVSALIGKKIQKIGWNNIMPENMRTLLHLNPDKVSNGGKIVEELGLSEGMKPAMDQLAKLSKKIKQIATVTPRLTKNVKDPTRIKEITADMAKRIKDMKREATVVIQGVRESGQLSIKQLENFDKLIKPEDSKGLQLYKQMVSFVVALLTLPVSATLLNVVYPPFVKTVAPGLAKAVEENR